MMIYCPIDPVYNNVTMFSKKMTTNTHQNGYKSKARYTKTKDIQCAQTQATQQQRALIRSKSVERIR